MSLLQDIQNMKYRSVIDLIKNEEPYDKKRDVINGYEAYDLCHKRYMSLYNLLSPLKIILGKDVIITGVNFVDGIQDDVSLLIRYTNGEKKSFITLTLISLDEFDVQLSDTSVDHDEFVEKNYHFLKRLIKELVYYGYNDDYEIAVNSTSSKFMMLDNCNSFNIADCDKKTFAIETNHQTNEENGIISSNGKTMSDYPRLKELLMDEENINKVYEHLHIYKDEFPKKLIKKIKR